MRFNRFGLATSLLAIGLAAQASAQCELPGNPNPPPTPPALNPRPTPPVSPGGNPGPSIPSTPSTNPAPSPGPATPPAPGPEAPTGGSGPATPGGGGSGPAPTPSTPLGGSSAPTTLPTDQLFDHESWERWWRHNGDAYLGIDFVLDRIHPETGRSDDARVDPLGERRAGLTYGTVYREVVPALRAILEHEQDTRLVRQAMLALARIGDRPDGHEPQAPFAPTILPFLAHSNIAVAETAVMALGVLGSIESAQALADLAEDSERGQALCRTSRVSVRIRAFAAYGLGLVGSQATRPELARFAMHHLAKVLTEDSDEYADLQAACVIGMGLVSVPASGQLAGDDDRPSTSLEAQVEHLLSVLENRRSSEMARAYVPTSLARVLQGTDHADLKIRVAKALIDRTDKRSRVKDSVRRSSIAALGRIGDADADPVDADIRSALQGAIRGKDGISRRFAVMALAEAGGRAGSGEGDPLEAAEESAAFLARTLSRGQSRLKPWAGLALGVLGSGLKQQGRLLSRGAADTLLHLTGDTKNAQEMAAYALGAGLIGDNRARRNLLERMDKVHDDEHRASMATALGLMGDRSALETLVAVMDDAHTKPGVMEQAAVGRALLGDRELMTDLLERLETGCDCWASYSGICRALSWTGDARAVPPLLALIQDDQSTALNRSLAVEALGRIADRSKLTWHTRISVGINYTAGPPTLTDPTGFGILDVL